MKGLPPILRGKSNYPPTLPHSYPQLLWVSRQSLNRRGFAGNFEKQSEYFFSLAGIFYILKVPAALENACLKSFVQPIKLRLIFSLLHRLLC